MLEMARLEPMESGALGAGPSSSWGVHQGVSLGGVVVLLIGLAGGGLVLGTRPSPPPPPLGDEEIRADSQQLAPVHAWRIWQELRATGLAPFPRLTDEQYKRASLVWRLELGAALAVVLVGAGAAGVPLLMRPKPSG